MSTSRTAFIDLLFNTALLFVALFFYAILLVRPVQAGKSVEQKAEFIIEMTWPDGSLDDVDLWLLTPSEQHVGWSNQDVGVVTLDRDDRGAYGDVYLDNGTKKLIRLNKEVMAIRAILPGRYVVNAHLYNDFTPEYMGFGEDAPLPLRILAKVTKLNPKVQEVAAAEITLPEVDAQGTLLVFDVDERGNVSNVTKEMDIPFVQLRKGAP